MTPAPELLPGIRWWRVIGGALLIELALTGVSVPFIAMGLEDDLMTVVPPVTLVVAFGVGQWVGRRAARPVLNAALAGMIAIPVYAVIVVLALVAQPGVTDSGTMLSPAYLATHVFKVLGAAAGGWWIGRRRAQIVGP